MKDPGQGVVMRDAPPAAANADVAACTSQGAKPPGYPAATGVHHQHAGVAFKHELSREQLEKFRRTNVFVSAGLALGCLLSIAAVAGLLAALFILSWPLAAAFYPLGASIIARQQRGLEVLVHDGSHRSWFRSNPVWNDRLTNWMAAYPMFSSVLEYWRFHRLHHADYGSERDPCRRRDSAMRAAQEPGKFFATIWSYTVGWYIETARKPAVMARAAIWHACVFIGPLCATVGVGNALMLWTVFWAVPQMIFLPWLRFVAELEEHDYSEGQTEATGTLTNVSWLHRWIIHPMKDGYHLVHHAYPTVPQWRLKAVHEALMRASSKYRHSRGRQAPLGKQVPLNNEE